MKSDSRFLARVAVVTGGASGIGEAVVSELAAGGARVFIGSRDAMRAEEKVSAYPCMFPVVARRLDVRSRVEVNEFFEDLPSPPQIFVSCAGGASRASALDLDDGMFEEAFQLNTIGFWRCAQEASKAAISSGGKLSIIHVGSSLFKGPAPNLSHFAAAKAACAALVRCFASEWASYGIRVNAVVPGPVETPMTAPVWNANPKLFEGVKSKIPMGRVGMPEDISRAVCWLASDHSEWVTGTLLQVDGGLAVSR